MHGGMNNQFLQPPTTPIIALLPCGQCQFDAICKNALINTWYLALSTSLYASLCAKDRYRTYPRKEAKGRYI